MRCKKHKWQRGGGAVCTRGQCIICKQQVGGFGVADKVCEFCSEAYGLCTVCGEKIEINTTKPLKRAVFENGMTVKQLKDLVKDLPETDSNGKAYEVWVTSGNDPLLSNQIKEVWPLNDGDILFEA